MRAVVELLLNWRHLYIKLDIQIAAVIRIKGLGSGVQQDTGNRNCTFLYAYCIAIHFLRLEFVCNQIEYVYLGSSCAFNSMIRQL